MLALARKSHGLYDLTGDLYVVVTGTNLELSPVSRKEADRVCLYLSVKMSDL